MPLTLGTVQRKAPWMCTACATHLSTSSAHSPLAKGGRYPRSVPKLLKQPVRTRFAPSPTGYLHLGSLRTALFNYLLAKCTGGQFILRIEDTDQKRTVPDAEKRILEDLRWAGLQWDEGPEVGGPYGPYRQSENTASYRDTANKLLFSGHAYRCFCSTKRLIELATQRHKLGLPTDYDRTCASISKSESDSRALKESHVIRLRCPDQYPRFKDLVYGTVGKEQQSQGVTRQHITTSEDPVLLKSDGQPTYHLANIVDDHRMNITHVVRAIEWLTATPKHIFMYDALGWKPPNFAHVGLLLDQHGHKLSKRKGNLDIAHYRNEDDILPGALINFVSLLGWSHNQKSDVMTLEQLVDIFDLKFTKGNTTVTFEKLWYLQKHHVQLAVERNGPEMEEVVHRLLKALREHPELNQEGEGMLRGRDLRSYVAAIIQADAKGYTTADEFLKRNDYFFKPVHENTPPLAYDSWGPGLKCIHTVSTHQLIDAATLMKDVSQESWVAERLKSNIQSIVSNICGATDAATKRLKSRALFHYLRWALAESHEGSSIVDVMVILGREITLSRLDRAANLCKDAQGNVVEVAQRDPKGSHETSSRTEGYTDVLRA
ncbi:MAG: Glutamate--tRNA ligase mitochondrial [Candelina mexicana]|nr:MAG: Glutamate--tRNA ligase mitochondrial [Candelina mexicana]